MHSPCQTGRSDNEITCSVRSAKPAGEKCTESWKSFLLVRCEDSQCCLTACEGPSGIWNSAQFHVSQQDKTMIYSVEEERPFWTFQQMEAKRELVLGWHLWTASFRTSLEQVYAYGRKIKAICNLHSLSFIFFKNSLHATLKYYYCF